jgi:hypothetical protein
VFQSESFIPEKQGGHLFAAEFPAFGNHPQIIGGRANIFPAIFIRSGIGLDFRLVFHEAMMREGRGRSNSSGVPPDWY